MVGLGVAILTLANGLWLGVGFAIVGVAVAIIVAFVAWKDWRRPATLQDQDPDRFWNAKKRWTALMGGSAASGLTFLAASLLFPNEQRWLAVGVAALIFVVSATVRLLLNRRER